MGKVKFCLRPISEVKCLILNHEQLVDLRNTPPEFQAALSAYTSFNGDVYHLHPHLVKECSVGPIGETEAVAALCELCASSISKSKIPVNSIASGVDFGSAERIKLPKMSLAEEYVIARGCVLLSIVKVSGYYSSGKQRGKRGHIITFPQPQGLLLLAEKKFTLNLF